jgi:hypothetical protein
MLSVKQIVLHELPFLEDTPEVSAKIETQRVLICYEMQSKFGKEDAETEEENNYTNRQNLLIGYLTTHSMLAKKVFANVAGEAGGEPQATQAIKKAKADVVETEFYETSSKNSLMLSTQELMDGLVLKICALARELGLTLLLCGECEPDLPIFKFVTE